MLQINSYSKEVEVRALIEGQFLRLSSHAEDLGYEIGMSCVKYLHVNILSILWILLLGPDSKVLATGGASTNSTIVQVGLKHFNYDSWNDIIKGSKWTMNIF